jgi:hypothetical protein
MNKNSTQKEIRNLVTKISDFLKLLPALPANLPGTDNCILIRYKNPVQLLPVFKSANFTFLNNRQPQTGFLPEAINQF